MFMQSIAESLEPQLPPQTRINLIENTSAYLAKRVRMICLDRRDLGDADQPRLIADTTSAGLHCLTGRSV